MKNLKLKKLFILPKGKYIRVVSPINVKDDIEKPLDNLHNMLIREILVLELRHKNNRIF